MSALKLETSRGRSSTTMMSHSSTSYFSVKSAGSSKSGELAKQTPLWGGAKFLPSGDCLPASFNLALIKKLPMFPPPTGALELYTHGLAEAPYQNKSRIDFDLTDPHNQCINNEYNPLTDPHMAMYLHKPGVYKRLQELGEITHDDKVRCSRKQYSQYAQWLQHMGHQQFRKRAEEERQKVAQQLHEEKKARLEAQDNLRVAVIHAEVTQEEQVTKKASPDTTSRGGAADASQVEVQGGEGSTSELHEVVGKGEEKDGEEEEEKRSQAVAGGQGELVPVGGQSPPVSDRGSEQSGSQLALVEREKKTDEEIAHERQMRAARDVYTKATKEQQKRQKRELHEYQKDWQRYLDYISEAEERRLDTSVKKFKAGWKRHQEYPRQFEDPPAIEDNQARELRYQHMLQDEINRRWQKQAGRLKDQKNKGRRSYQALEKVYTQNILRAFNDMPLTDHLEVSESPVHVNVEPPCTPMTPQRKRAPGPDGSTTLSTHLAIEPLCPRRSSRGRLGSRHGSLYTSLTGFQKSNRGTTPSRKPPKKVTTPDTGITDLLSVTYPTRTRILGNDEPQPHPGDEVCIYVPQEVLLQTAKDCDASISASEGKMETSLIPDTTFTQDMPSESCEGLTIDEKHEMEGVIEGLLKDMTDGRLDREQLMQLISICAALTESRLAEQATSTTSLDEDATAKASKSSLMTQSGRSSRKPSASPWEDTEDTEDLELSQLAGDVIEEVVRDTVCRLSKDREEGTLSSEDVREIGSAMASTILGEIRSDSTILGDEVVLPTLEGVLAEGQTIEDELVDNTMASLLSANDTPTRQSHKTVWQTIKNFVVELLKRTKVAMECGKQDLAEFLTAMEQCEKTPLLSEMDLPCSHELLEVMSMGVSKLEVIEEVCPLLCELVKVLLDQGHSILLTRPEASKISIPHFDVASLELVSSSACGLEVAVEVGATVADMLLLAMVADRSFETSLYLSLSPSLLLVLLTCWAELIAAVPKETVALQTSFAEIGYVPTLGEDVILLALFRLWRDIMQENLSNPLLALLTLQVAQLPILGQCPCTIVFDSEGRVIMSEDMFKKIVALAQEVREEALDYSESKKLLSCVLQMYVNQVLQQPADTPIIPGEVMEDIKTCRYHMADLIANIARAVLEGVLVKARQQQVETDPNNMNFMLVADILQIMSDCALADIKDSLKFPRGPTTPAPLDDFNLQNVIQATTTPQTSSPGDKGEEVTGFLQRVVNMIDSCPKPSMRSIVLHTELRVEGHFIRTELGKMAAEVCEMLCSLVPPPRQEVTSSSVLDKMTRFLVSLLEECQKTLQGSLLTPEVMYHLLYSLMPSLAYREQDLRDSQEGQLELIASLICDLKKNRNKSSIFKKFVRKLSMMSIDKADSDEVAEGMAAIAQALSRLDGDILHSFVQSTLYSLLASIKETPSVLNESAESVQRMKEAVDTTLSSTLADSGVMQADNRQHLPGKSGDSEQMGVDANSKKEISHEADIIIHMAIQTTLDRLGLDIGISPALAGLPHQDSSGDKEGGRASKAKKEGGKKKEEEGGLEVDKEAVVDHEVKELVTNLQDAAALAIPPPRTDFSDLDPSVAAYAQDLLMQVTRHMEDTEDASVSQDERGVMNVESIASTILSKTFKSIETGLITGKLIPQPAQPAEPSPQSADLLAVDSAGMQEKCSLSGCVTNTLCAVRSELDLLDLVGGSSDVDDTPAVPMDTTHTLKRARQIVDFLMQCLQCDTEAAKVEFKWSPDQKLSVVNSEKTRSVAVDSSVWTAHPVVIAETILQTFCKVLKDMQSQNQFFNPDVVEAPVVQVNDIFMLPSLPFLLDEFILSHLHNITVQFFNYVQGQKAKLDTITREAVMVICSFSEILVEMMDLAKPASCSEADREIYVKKLTVFRILDEYATRLLNDVYSGCSNEGLQSIVESHRKDLQDSGHQRKEEREKAERAEKTEADETAEEADEDETAEEAEQSINRKQTKKSSLSHGTHSLVVYRPIKQIKTDLTKLLASVENLKKAVRPKRVHEENLGNALDNSRDISLYVINQIMASVKKGYVPDYILRDLVHIFVDPQDSLDKEGQTMILLCELDALATALLEGKIPENEMTTIAAEISILEKRHVEDPRRIAQQMRRVSLSCTGFSPEYLKMTVADLLTGYRRSSDPIPESHRVAFPFPMGSSEDSEGQVNRRWSYSLSGSEPPVTGVQSSIEARTISKVCLWDDSENRECAPPTVYATQVTLKGGPPYQDTLCAVSSIIAEQSENVTPTPGTSVSSDTRLADPDAPQLTGRKEDQEPKDCNESMEVMVNSASWYNKEKALEEGQESEQLETVPDENIITSVEEEIKDSTSTVEIDISSKASSVKGDKDTEECISSDGAEAVQSSKASSAKWDEEDILSEDAGTDRSVKEDKDEDEDAEEDVMASVEAESGISSKAGSVKGDNDAEENAIVSDREDTGKDSKASSPRGDETPADETPANETPASTTGAEPGNTQPEAGEGQTPIQSANSSQTDLEAANDAKQSSEDGPGPEQAANEDMDSEREQGGGEDTEATPEIGGANRSEESLTSAEGDCNRSAIRRVRQDLVCRVDEVKALEILPSKNQPQSLIGCQSLQKRRNKTQNLSTHHNGDQNQHRQHDINRHLPEPQTKQLSGERQGQFLVQPNESGYLARLQPIGSQRLTPVQQNGQRLSECRPFSRREFSVEPFPSLQNTGQHYPAQQNKPHNFQNTNVHLQNKSHNLKDTEWKLSTQKTAHQHFLGRQNIDQHLALQLNTRREELAAEEKAARQGTLATHNITAASDQSAKISVQTNTEMKSTRGLLAYRKLKNENSSSTFDTSLRSLKTTSQMKESFASREDVSTPCSESVGSQMNSAYLSVTVPTESVGSQMNSAYLSVTVPTESAGSQMNSAYLSITVPTESAGSQMNSAYLSVTVPTEPLSSPAPALLPRLEKQPASQSSSSQALTGPEKRTQQKAFGSSLSVFDSSVSSKSTSRLRHMSNTKQVEHERLKSDNGNVDRPLFTTQTISKKSSFPPLPVQKTSVRSLMEIYQPSALAPLSRSKQNASAKSQGLAKAARKERNHEMCEEISAVPHPPSTQRHPSVREGAGARKIKDRCSQQSLPFSRASEKSTLAERGKAKEPPEISPALPFSLRQQSSKADAQHRREGYVNQGTGVQHSVTFPFIPTQSSGKGVREEAGRLIRCYVADELAGVLPRGQRNETDDRLKNTLELDSNNQSKLILPHPPREAPKKAVDELRLKLSNVLQSLKTANRGGSADKQKHRHRSTTVDPQAKYISEPDLKAKYGNDLQRNDHTNWTEHKHRHPDKSKELKSEKSYVKENVHSKGGYMTSVVDQPGPVRQPKVPHPQKQPPPDQCGHTPMVNGDQSGEYENPHRPVNVSGRQRTSAVARLVSALPPPTQARRHPPSRAQGCPRNCLP